MTDLSYAERLAQDRRGILLRALDESGAPFSLVERSLRTVLDLTGHKVSTLEMRADLEWLERGGLVRIERQAVQSGEVWVVQLLDEGQVVARGRAHQGVGRQGFAPVR